MNKFKRLIRYDLPLHFILMLTNWLPDNVIFIRFRGWLSRPFFKKCGKKLGIGRNVTFYNPSKIEIGNNVYIALGCWFSSSLGVIIKDEVMFGPYNVIVSSNHTSKNGSFRFGESKGGEVVFNNGCWIGANCTILAKTIVGKGSVVAANSVASGVIPENCIYGGNPGKFIKFIDE